MTPQELAEGVKLAFEVVVALAAAVGVVALAWLVWRLALYQAQKVVIDTWKDIAGAYEARVEQLESRIADLEAALDTYGCANAPSCPRRVPRLRLAALVNDPT